MNQELTLGLLGVTTGSAMNSVGRMLGTIDSSESSTVPKVQCKAGEAKWHADSTACFTPSQIHVNLLITSISINCILVLILLIMFFTRKVSK